MTNKNILTVKINKQAKTEAGYMSRSFIKPEIKNRAYINTLGSEIIMNYLHNNEIIGEEKPLNIHSIIRILENLDISDILLPNIHLDVRVIFDEQYLFIPKSHFDLEILPDAYVFIKIGADYEDADIYGYIEPKNIDKSKSNSQYYFVNIEDLQQPQDLVNFVKNFEGKVYDEISDDEMHRGRELSVFLADHHIEEDDFKELLGLLRISPKLREAVIEYDNFETLSYSVATYMKGKAQATDLEKEYNYEEQQEPEVEKNENNSDIDAELEIPEDLELDEDLDIGPLDDDSSNENSKNNLLDNAIDIAEAAATGIVGAGALAAGAGEIAAGAQAQEMVNLADLSNEAMKLTGMAGEEIGKVVENIANDQNKNVDNIDYTLSEDVYKEMPDENSDDLYGLPFGENEDLPIKSVKDEDFASDMSDLEIVENTDYAPVDDHVGIDIEDLPETQQDIPENIDNTTDFESLSKEDQFAQIENVDENISDEIIDISEPEDDINSDLAENSSDEDIEQDSNSQDDLEFNENPEEESNNERQEENITDEDVIEEESIDNTELETLKEDMTNEQGNSENVEEREIEQQTNQNEELTNDNIETDNTQEAQEETSDITGSETVVDLTDFENNGEHIENSEENNYDFQEVSAEDMENLFDIENVKTENSISANDQNSDSAPVIKNKEPYENSTTITNKGEFVAGEISIDINNNIEPTYQDEAGHLESIYNESESLHENSMLSNPARFVKQKFEQKPPALLAVVSGVIAIALVTIIGLSALKMFKPAPKDNQPITRGNNTPQMPEPIQPENPNTLDVDKNNVVNMPNANTPTSSSNTPIVNPANVNTPVVKPQQIETRKLAASEYLEVSKLSWEVPDYISYSPDFQKYFQSTGKSLKSAVSSDLLLANDYAYSDQIRLSILFDRSGMFKEAKVLLSSGSSEVDKIVLQSVNQTLRVLKAPNSLGNDESTTVILKIYF